MNFPPTVVQVDGSPAPEWINDKTCKFQAFLLDVGAMSLHHLLLSFALLFIVYLMHGSIHEICSKKPVALNIILRTFKKGFTPTSFPAFAYMTVIASLKKREASFFYKGHKSLPKKSVGRL